MILVVVILAFLWLQGQGAPAAAASSSGGAAATLAGLPSHVEGALAVMPNRVLTASGLSVSGDPRELTRVPIALLDPSSLNSAAAGGALNYPGQGSTYVNPADPYEVR